MFWVTFKNRDVRNRSKKVENPGAVWQLRGDAHPDPTIGEFRVRTAAVDDRGNPTWQDVTDQF